MIQADIVTAGRAVLRASTTTIWSDAQLNAFCDLAVKDISIRYPIQKYVNLAVVQYTKSVVISSLTDLIDIIHVEYPVGNPGYDPVYRKFAKNATEISLDLTTIPTITSGTLTGTVTFTQNSRSITGSGTLFTTELDTYGLQGHLIAHSSGTKYYQAAYPTSATALTLMEPFLETTATDTVSVTKYRSYDSVARICYGASYTVSTTTDMPLECDPVAILGTVAYAAMSLVSDYNKTDIETVLDGADTNLGLGVTNINAVSPGGDLASKYNQIASTQGGLAGQRNVKNSSFSSWAGTKWGEYQKALTSIERMRVYPSTSRE